MAAKKKAATVSAGLAWLAVGQTITADIMETVGNLPDAAKAELWQCRTLNKDAVAKIKAALDAAKETKKEGGDE